MHSYSAAIDDIVRIQIGLSKFWKNAHGWAPDGAAAMLASARLELMPSLAAALYKWTPETTMTDGELILAWANLGSLMESSLRLFLAVYLEDFLADHETVKSLDAMHKKGEKTGTIHDPTEISLEKMRQYFTKKDLLSPKDLAAVAFIQGQRNAIHSFSKKDIGSAEIFSHHIFQFRRLIAVIGLRLPYPDGFEFEGHVLARKILAEPVT
ncbi:hypothetical protein [Rhizobium sp. BK376]|uniref:hypothetical protein n=1 Tax=Rhizobium sp. BK376 TaxID=2512149 RepID=UPI001045345B|nr:hypothetical protein [Rhizobium sp. BK376]TCR76843.1 hypothetical protein EV561_119103 [Rhizobium sp. BK376]